MSDRLEVQDVSKRFGETTVLSDVSLAAAPGDTVAIVGPSGSGKSTLLNIIGSLEAPTEGTVIVDGIHVESLHGADLAEFRAKRVGFVFQEHHLLPQLTARENVQLPCLAAHVPSAVARADELLDRVGVAPRADAFPASLSGGERQRVALARALMNRPGLLLCDEPTGNLDQEKGSAVIDLLIETARRDGVIVLMVTHNLEHASRFARSFVLRGGVLTASPTGS